MGEARLDSRTVASVLKLSLNRFCHIRHNRLLAAAPRTACVDCRSISRMSTLIAKHWLLTLSAARDSAQITYGVLRGRADGRRRPKTSRLGAQLRLRALARD